MTPERVAILKPCCLGDCVMALPAIDTVLAAWPASEVDVFVGAHSRSAFAFRSRLHLRRVRDSLDVPSALQLSRVLRQGQYDLVVVLDRSRLLNGASRLARARKSVAIHTRAPELRHETEVYLDVMRQLGISTPVTTPSITPSVVARQAAKGLLPDQSAPLSILHPGGARNPGANMLEKRWPADRFTQLASELKRDGISVLLSGGPDDVALASQIARDAGLEDWSILAGRTDIGTLAAILEQAAVYVGPDTGVSHIAAAVGTPTVAIFGPTNPRRYRPLGPDVHVLAPAASWSIVDRDLRRRTDEPGPISTNLVTFDPVLRAAREAIDRHQDRRRCND
ncbi:MAG TPA: glycosyltransferase family 9 protein [Thermomicrobiales bacterium]|nr:glycosyltransferase family 9 protein [Thermomicrobiales bacterium]